MIFILLPSQSYKNSRNAGGMEGQKERLHADGFAEILSALSPFLCSGINQEILHDRKQQHQKFRV